MSCLGGTPERPKPWVRYRPDGTVIRERGRICQRTQPRTSRRKCAACPAFRGIRWDGVVANGLAPDDSPVGLSLAEHEAYQRALDAALYDDDDELMFAFMGRMTRELVTRPDGTHTVIVGIGERGLLRIGDPDAMDRHAARMRTWRKAHPGSDRRRRKRDRAAYMRAYRAKRTVP